MGMKGPSENNASLIKVTGATIPATVDTMLELQGPWHHLCGHVRKAKATQEGQTPGLTSLYGQNSHTLQLLGL